MKIKFKKKYTDKGVTWMQVVADFIEYLSERYGYTIDEFDLTAMPDLMIQNKLGELVNKEPQSDTYRKFFLAAAQRSISSRKVADETRSRYQECVEVVSQVTTSKMKKEQEG